MEYFLVKEPHSLSFYAFNDDFDLAIFVFDTCISLFKSIAGPNGPISPFHDIPLWREKENNVFNMVVEVPSMDQRQDGGG